MMINVPLGCKANRDTKNPYPRKCGLQMYRGLRFDADELRGDVQDFKVSRQPHRKRQYQNRQGRGLTKLPKLIYIKRSKPWNVKNGTFCVLENCVHILPEKIPFVISIRALLQFL